MADYAIGDIQGCFSTLEQLLEHIQYDLSKDRLWFVGDLVNRGPQSLAVLRFLKNLSPSPQITLGNHDLYFLTRLYDVEKYVASDDTLNELLQASDREELGEWLRQQPILIHDDQLNIVMTHAGIFPYWTLEEAKTYAVELEAVLRGNDFKFFLQHMFGNHPNHWSPRLTGIERLRVICNIFTRMRFIDGQHHLRFDYKGTPNQAPADLYPWFAMPNRKEIDADIVFGHWAALNGICPNPRIYAIDTGSIWGGPLTALRLQDKQLFSVPG